MTQRKIIPVNLINLVVIASVMVVLGLLTHSIIDELTVSDIESVTRLTQTNIYAEVTKELIEPINTAVIMAQNTLLPTIMNGDTPETEAVLAKYLSQIQEATGYESVFLVPHSTLNYYHPGGTDEKVDLSTDYANWYKVRIDAKDDYAVIVNTEQLDDWALTVYVDANMEADQGNFIGITGVGKRLNHLQNILAKYIADQGVEAYLVDDDGLIKVHPDTTVINKKTIYDLEALSSDLGLIHEDESLAKEGPDKQGYIQERRLGNKFIIVQYMPMLDWHLVVTKSTSEVTVALNQYMKEVYTTLVLGALLIMLFTSLAITRYKQQIVRLSNTDQLTGVPNRTIFDQVFEDAIANLGRQEFCMALFDIDNLKTINDQLGHDRGDDALKIISDLAIQHIEAPNLVARIGGDEFGLILFKSLEESEGLLQAFHLAVQENKDLDILNATISVGLTIAKSNDTASMVYKRADEALYNSKGLGKNTINLLL